MHVQQAKQGHRYKLGFRSVIAMQSGYVVEVREIDMNEPYPLTNRFTVKASWLQPEPMVYHGNEIPT